MKRSQKEHQADEDLKEMKSQLSDIVADEEQRVHNTLAAECFGCGGSHDNGICNYPKIGSDETLYYKMEVLVKVPSHIHREWSELSDVDGHLISFLKDKAHLVNHESINKSYYDTHKHAIFDEDGNI